jgi:hypothetical protein
LRLGQLVPHACCVFRFAVFVPRALCRAAMTAASALLSSAPLAPALSSSSALPALDGARG